jgi:hypothetical protein
MGIVFSAIEAIAVFKAPVITNTLARAFSPSYFKDNLLLRHHSVISYIISLTLQYFEKV